GEVYLGDASTVASWTIGRQLNLQIAAHILSPFGIAPIFDRLAQNQLGSQKGNKFLGVGPDNLFIHMTGMSDAGWKAVHDRGAQVSLAGPIRRNTRHALPPSRDTQAPGT